MAPHRAAEVSRTSADDRQITLVAKVSGNVSGSASDRIGISGDIAQSVDRKVPVFDVKTMEDRLDAVAGASEVLRDRRHVL